MDYSYEYQIMSRGSQMAVKRHRSMRITLCYMPEHSKVFIQFITCNAIIINVTIFHIGDAHHSFDC